MGGQQITSYIRHAPLQGTVHRRHKEESGNEDSDIDDSNQGTLLNNVDSVTTRMRAETIDSPAPYSPYIAQVASDFSQELHDSEHVVSSVTQALRLWQASGLDEQAFVSLMYEAKTLTRKYQTRSHWDALANKMSYYFKVLRDLVQRVSSD